ncbi:APC family permease [Pengzhenrongella frigida]|uniref:APC family permease n=1 Tax=Pengzhenrongella frigida TaxID=1259133 RepID=UPI002104C87F|nr:APC family permease [Cellulomonas sp. HLT2-17]
MVTSPVGSLTGKLGTTSIVFMVVAAAAPLTVIGGAAPLGMLLGNGVGFPALYAISGVILLLFAVGLAAMTRVVPRPGAFFTYIGYGLGNRMGLAAAFLALLTYTTIQVSVYGYLGYILELTFTGLGAPSIPWWIWSLTMVAAVGVLGYRHIDVSSKVLGVLLLGEIGIVLLLVLVVVVTGGADGLSFTSFEPAQVTSGSPAIGLMFAIAAFIGFEATAIFRDEARDPEKTIPRATYAAVIGVGLFYTVASWGLIMAWGPDKIMAAVAEDPGGLILRTTERYLGSSGEVVVNVLLITSMFACVLSFHNVLARYQHSMAGVGALPSGLGRVHHSHLSPHTSSFAQTITGGVLVLLSGVLGLDPVLEVFTWFSGVATLAIAVLMAVTSIAVIVWFSRSTAPRSIWRTVVAPSLGLVGLVVAALAIGANFPMLVGDVDAAGVPRWGALSLGLVGLVLILPAIGWVQGTVMKQVRPQAYERLTDSLT